MKIIFKSDEGQGEKHTTAEVEVSNEELKWLAEGESWEVPEFRNSIRGWILGNVFKIKTKGSYAGYKEDIG